MNDAEAFIRRVMAPRRDPPWWRDLAGEQRQGRPPGRYLEDTLERELAGDVPAYRRSERRQHFFARSRGEIDGRFADVGVEEKYRELSFDGLVDGAICRCLVWVFGNPYDRPLAEAYRRVLAAIEEVSVRVIFIDEVSGDYWPRLGAAAEDPPSWWAEAGGSRQPAVALGPVDRSGLEALRAYDRRQSAGAGPTRRLLGGPYRFLEVTGGRALAECDNHWRMLEVGPS